MVERVKRVEKALALALALAILKSKEGKERKESRDGEYRGYGK